VVDEVRLKITAPFCAGVVETIGAAVIGVGVPMLLALAPPHPHSQALDKIMPVSAIDPVHMAELHSQEVGRTILAHPFEFVTLTRARE
jgi:hypothetical protein